MFAGMLGQSGAVLPQSVAGSAPWITELGFRFGEVPSFAPGGVDWLVLGALLAITLVLPNTCEFMSDFEPALGVSGEPRKRPGLSLRWLPRPAFGVVMGIVAALAVFTREHAREFPYFNF